MKKKKMSKTWETLFNLSSFMKYLLTKELPDEKLEAPSYILDSLHDLLAVTSSWIEKIKPLANNNVSLKNQLAYHSAQVTLSSRNNKNPEVSISEVNANKNLSTCNLPSGSAPFNSANSSNDEFNNNKVAKLVNPTKDVTEEFKKLSKEMINGRPFGYYCRPCDSVIFSKKDWDDHMADRLHIFLIDCDIKFGSCVYCKLVVFAANRDINKLFKYHEMEHQSRNHNNIPPKENADMNEINNIPSKSRGSNYVKTDLDVITSRVADIDVNYNFKTNQRISPVFIELDKKIHSGQEKGFYCHICDKAFEAVPEWNLHFQEVAVHNDQYDSSGCFEMCDSCSLVIFAVPSVQKWYKSHHMCGHYCFKGEKKSNFKSSVESLQSTTHSQDNLQSYKNNPPYPNNQSSNAYKITEKFMDFNAAIHAQNLQGHFYCRPCNAAIGPDEWSKHSVNRKHQELMSSRKFKNWKGTCTYCSLTIIGTRDTVKYYMEFHSVQHDQVVSYDFHEISSCSTSNNFSSKQNRRKHRTRKVTSPNPVSTMGDEEDESDFEEKEINNIKNEASSISPNVSGETSWYASSREEQLQDAIRQLIDSRTKEKYTNGNPQFGGLCTLCEYTNNNAFEWQDHLCSSEHCQRKTPHDRHGFLSDLNIYLFGNKNVFEKYKSLIKGNWSFIED